MKKRAQPDSEEDSEIKDEIEANVILTDRMVKAVLAEREEAERANEICHTRYMEVMNQNEISLRKFELYEKKRNQNKNL